jgi:hypothetical protein
MSVDLLEGAATALGSLRSRVVFLGGATIGLWMTDAAARSPRVTDDVDVIAEVATLVGYESFQAELREVGSAEDRQSQVICRWRHKGSGLILDAIPAEPRLAGLLGRWLAPAAEAAVEHRLPSGTGIRVVPPPYLLATKLEAFADRGNYDCLSSRDFEDVILLIDSRAELAEEIKTAPGELRTYIRGELGRLLKLRSFDYGVEGALTGPQARQRADAVTVPRLRVLAG